MDFREIAALGQEPTPADLEPFITAYLEQHGPTKRIDLARSIETEWETASGRPFQTDVMAKLKNALVHMQKRGGVAPTGVFGVWGLVDDEAAVAEPWTETELVSAPTYGPDAPVALDADSLELGVETAGAIELGEGAQLVYCFYLPTYRYKAGSEGKSQWPIKIGSTTGPLATRLSSFSTALPERPHVAVVIRTHDAGLLERALQNVLSYRGRWIAEAAGSEWYLTTPEEIARLYEFISDDTETTDA